MKVPAQKLTLYTLQGWTGKLFFSRGGVGRGGARPKFYGAGRDGEPHLVTVRGRAGKGSRSVGRGGDGAGIPYIFHFFTGQNFWRIKFAPKNAIFSR